MCPTASRAESRLTAGLLPASSKTHYGFKNQVFLGSESANSENCLACLKPIDGVACSLNCPISVPAVASFGLRSSQLSLPLHVHHIDRGLSLAPSGKWSHLDYEINRDDLVNEFLTDLKTYLGKKRFNKKLYFDVINMLLANFLAVHYSSGQLLLDRMNGKHKNSNPLRIDNRTIATVCDYFADRGLIDLHIGKRNQNDNNSSWCIPLPELITILDQEDARIRLHEKTQFAVVRDADKNAKPMYKCPDKRRQLINHGRPVERYYKTWLNHAATLDGFYILPWIRRLFNHSMELGGRFYGYYQQIPSSDRKRILIDGQRTVELDYKSVHIALLYALEGLPVNTDPYVIDGHADKRSTFKAICLRLVNSDDLNSFKANITRSGNVSVQQDYDTYTKKRQHYERQRALKLKATPPIKPKSISKGFIKGIPVGAVGDDLLSLVLERHKPIAHHFGTKNIGLRLQRLDSELIARALGKIEDIPCLPVHDSIRCKVSDIRRVHEAMTSAFKELHGQDITVTNDLPTTRKDKL